MAAIVANPALENVGRFLGRGSPWRPGARLHRGEPPAVSGSSRLAKTIRQARILPGTIPQLLCRNAGDNGLPAGIENRLRVWQPDVNELRAAWPGAGVTLLLRLRHCHGRDDRECRASDA